MQNHNTTEIAPQPPYDETGEIQKKDSLPQLVVKLNSNITLSNAGGAIVSRAIAANTFVNPAFISNTAAGRSNWDTEQQLTTYRYDGGNLVLPRGYMRELLDICKEIKTTPKIIDERVFSACSYPDRLIRVELRSYQKRAVHSALKYDQGCIISPTGSGKSIIGLEIIRQRKQRALIIVHRGELAAQWIKVIGEVLGLKAGFIGDGQWSIGDEITVAMVQTLKAREIEVQAIAGGFGTVIIDELQHTPCSTFFDVIGHFASKYRYGLSATPQRRDGLEPIIYRGIGSILAEIPKSEVEDMGATVPATVYPIKTGFNPGTVNSWQQYIFALSTDTARNSLIVKLAEESEGATLILTDLVSHAMQLSQMLITRGIPNTLAHGQIKKKDRAEMMQQVKLAQLTVGTSSLLGEGIDIATWGTLIMASPISSTIKLLQCIGRVVRPSSGKERAIVHDLMDDCGFSGSSFKKRFEIYKQNKIEVQFKEKFTKQN